MTDLKNFQFVFMPQEAAWRYIKKFLTSRSKAPAPVRGQTYNRTSLLSAGVSPLGSDLSKPPSTRSRVIGIHNHHTFFPPPHFHRLLYGRVFLSSLFFYIGNFLPRLKSKFPPSGASADRSALHIAHTERVIFFYYSTSEYPTATRRSVMS